MKKNLMPLSWSRISVYRQCPRQFEAKYITKQYPDESDNPAFTKGNMVHKQLEDYINSLKGKKVKSSMGLIAIAVKPIIDSFFRRFVPEDIHAEKQLALDHNYKECDWFASADVVKWRAIIDMLVKIRCDRLYVNDFKTGKVREYAEERGQLHLTSMLLFELYPEIESITCSYLFTEHKESRVVTFQRAEHVANKAAFDLEWALINEDTDFDAKKNKYCHFCGVKDECEFG